MSEVTINGTTYETTEAAQKALRAMERAEKKREQARTVAFKSAEAKANNSLVIIAHHLSEWTERGLRRFVSPDVRGGNTFPIPSDGGYTYFHNERFGYQITVLYEGACGAWAFRIVDGGKVTWMFVGGDENGEYEPCVCCRVMPTIIADALEARYQESIVAKQSA